MLHNIAYRCLCFLTHLTITTAIWEKSHEFSSTMGRWPHVELLNNLRGWEGLGAGEGDDRGWDGWMASPTRWTWIWVKSGRWWWTGRPGMLWFMGSQRVRHDWATELNWIDLRVSLVAQLVKNRPAVQETQFNSSTGKIPWRRAWQPIPVLLPGKSPWTEEPGGLGRIRWGHKDMDMTELVSTKSQ